MMVAYVVAGKTVNAFVSLVTVVHPAARKTDLVDMKVLLVALISTEEGRAF